MAQTQSITRTTFSRRTVNAKSGMVLPATLTPQTDFNLMDTACVVYHRVTCSATVKALGHI
jgi:hypothetical protein